MFANIWASVRNGDKQIILMIIRIADARIMNMYMKVRIIRNTYRHMLIHRKLNWRVHVFLFTQVFSYPSKPRNTNTAFNNHSIVKKVISPYCYSDWLGCTKKPQRTTHDNIQHLPVHIYKHNTQTQPKKIHTHTHSCVCTAAQY